MSLIWQRIKGEIPKELDITRDKYRGSTNTKLVVRKISKKDEGGYRAVIHRDSIGNQDNLISNTIFLVAEGGNANFYFYGVSCTLIIFLENRSKTKYFFINLLFTM